MCDQEGCDIDYGLCHCGCGQKTTVPEKTSNPEGRVSGVPMRFCQGHNSRVDHPRAGKSEKHMADGYVQVHRPDHPRSSRDGYVYEHILVASQAMGKPVPDYADVHHVNGDKTDNRPQNLVVCSRSYHQILHKRTKALEETGDPNSVRCWLCHRWGGREQLSVPENGSPYHKDCAARYVRMRRKMPPEDARMIIRGNA